MKPEDILEFLQKLAEQLTPAAKYVYELAVRQTIIEGFQNLLLAGFLLIVLPFIYYQVSVKFIKPLYQKEVLKKERAKNYYDDMGDAGLLAGLYLLVTILFGIFVLPIGITSLFSALNYLLNPEWQTILKLAELVR
jgi:hypothetical protein